MNRTLLVLGITLAAGLPARADLQHKIMSSVQLQVGGAVTTAERLGSSFSISGTNIDTTDGTTANTVSAGTITSGVYSPALLLQRKTFQVMRSPSARLTAKLMPFQHQQ